MPSPFRRPKHERRTCERGHPQEPTWDRCPFCTAGDLSGPAPASTGTETAALPQAPEAGRGAVVVPKKEAPARRALAGWLVAIGGELEGDDFRVHVGRNVIGKGGLADIVLRDAYVSERHALLESRNGTCTVTDLESRNGTSVNGRRIDDTVEVKDGDRIALGHTELRYRSLD